MRLLYITVTMPFGDSESFFIPEVQELRRLGWELLIVPRDPDAKVVNRDASDLEALSVCEHIVSWNTFAAAVAELLRHPLRCLGAFGLLLRSRSPEVLAKNLIVYSKALWLARLARKWGADHIHAQWTSTTATMAMLAGHISGIPWSCTAHRGDIAENNLLRSKASRAGFMRFISASGLRMAQGFGVPAAATNTPVIHLGVRLPPERPPATAHDGAPTAICPAGLLPVKGQKYLLQALAILKDRGLELSLDIAGEGELKAELQALTAALGLEKCVRFLGYVPHNEVLQLYAAGKIDLLVLPSVSLPQHNHEGIPVSLMEAMAWGIPVLSTATGGIPELLHDGAGIMVPPQDAAALADALERLVRDPDLRRQLAVAGRRRIEEEFDVRATASRLADCIRAAGPRRQGSQP
jgi:glycosyltransferase involved in cell wall biosynthesis